MDTTALIIVGSIVSITSLIIAILKLANEKAIANSKMQIEQAILSEKLASIEIKLAEIKVILCNTENKYNELQGRVHAIETNCKIIQEKKTPKRSKKGE